MRCVTLARSALLVGRFITGQQKHQQRMDALLLLVLLLLLHTIKMADDEGLIVQGSRKPSYSGEIHNNGRVRIGPVPPGVVSSCSLSVSGHGDIGTPSPLTGGTRGSWVVSGSTY